MKVSAMIPEMTDEAPALERLLDAVDPDIARILGKSLSGGEVEPQEGLRLFDTEGLELQALLKTADTIRRKRVGNQVSFVVVRNINFTNICYTGCRFCAFAKHRDDPEAEFLPNEHRSYAHADVAIVGGGIAGASIAHSLNARGYKSTIIDKYNSSLNE